MQILRVLALGLISFAGAGGALAQSWPFDLTAQGRLALGASDRVPGADLFLFGDATTRLSYGSFGLELGVFGLADAIDTPHETYGALTYDFAQGGRFSIGVPRPAYDSFAVSALEGPFPSLGVARTGTSRSLATFGAMFANFLPYGVRFENQTDALRYAASVHSVPNQNLTIAGLGLAYPMGDWTLEGAVEVAWGATSEVAGKVQVHGMAGPVKGGVGLYFPGTVGGPEAIELFAGFEPFESVTVTGVVQAPLDGSTDPSGGVSARYMINPSFGISAGVLSDAGADPSFNAAIDFRF